MCLGIPGVVERIVDHDAMLGEVSVSGVSRPVNLSCVIAPGESLTDCVGRWVLVHVGFALSVIDEAEAQQMLTALAQLGELDEWTADRAASQMQEVTV